MNCSALCKACFGLVLASALFTSETLGQQAEKAANELTLDLPLLESLDPTLADQAPIMHLAPDLDTAQELGEAGQPTVATCPRQFEEVPSGAKEAAATGGEECVDLVDAVPMMVGPDGRIVPIVSSSSAAQIELRLGERRAKLVQVAEDLGLRAALLEAAEMSIEERTVALQVLVDSMSAKQKAGDTEDAANLTALVSMYEAMKPNDAATIFDDLSRDVLIPIVRAMNPRRAAAIIARMRPGLASDVTARLAQGFPGLK